MSYMPVESRIFQLWKFVTNSFLFLKKCDFTCVKFYFFSSHLTLKNANYKYYPLIQKILIIGKLLYVLHLHLPLNIQTRNHIPHNIKTVYLTKSKIRFRICQSRNDTHPQNFKIIKNSEAMHPFPRPRSHRPFPQSRVERWAGKWGNRGRNHPSHPHSSKTP